MQDDRATLASELDRLLVHLRRCTVCYDTLCLKGHLIVKDVQRNTAEARRAARADAEREGA